MPNWITNIFDVHGSEADVKAFRDKVYRKVDDEETFDFNTTVPMPKELSGTTSPTPKDDEKSAAKRLKKYGAANWYDWSVQNWGTKWNACDSSDPESILNGLRFTFNTAWAPPAQWIAETAKQFPSLEFVDHWKDESGGAGKFQCRWDTTEKKLVYKDEQMDDHDWEYQFNHDYKDQYDLITSGDQKEVVKKYQNEKYMDYYSLTNALLDRLLDSDLPLFIDFDWGSAQEKYEGRLKKPTHDPVLDSEKVLGIKPVTMEFRQLDF